MYHHKYLTLEEQEHILKYLSMGYSIAKFVMEINRSKSTVARELKRNTLNGEYLPITADTAYKKRGTACRPKK